MGDTERLDWFEQQVNKGGCPALIFNDNGWWAVLTDGTQNIDVDDPPSIPFIATYMADDGEDLPRWKETVREAIDYAMKEDADA